MKSAITTGLDDTIPKLQDYSNEEIYQKIIFPLCRSFPEIAWFADDRVAVTQEAAGQTQKAGWTERLTSTESSFKKGKGKYIELERMLSSIVFFNLFLCKASDGVKEGDEYQKVLEKSYQKFVSVQRNGEKLSFQGFLGLHTLARKVVRNKELYEAVVLMLVMSDLGKTPEAKKRALEVNLLKSDHDDFIEGLLSFPENTRERKTKLETIIQIFPSFQNVPETTQALLQKVASAMKIHLGHVYHIEGGQQMFAKFEGAVSKGVVTSAILDFAFLIQLSDVAASVAHIDCNGSLALNENTYQGYCLVGESLRKIQQGGSSKDALLFYLKSRGRLLGLSADTPMQRVLIRLASWLRFFSPEEGILLQKGLERLSDKQKNLLVEQFGIEEPQVGMNAWARNPTYVPAVLVNLLQLQKTDEPKQVKVERALEGACCIAIVLQRYAEVPEHRHSLNPLSFNGYAGIAGKTPKFLSLKHFNPNFISFEGDNVNLDTTSQISAYHMRKMFTFGTTAIEKLASENRSQLGMRRLNRVAKKQLASQLDTEYKLFESLHSNLHYLSAFDMVVCLSGRGNLEGTLCQADKEKLAKQGRDSASIDTLDTIDRFRASVNLAKMQNAYNMKFNCQKRVLIYFNGTQEQNKQLRAILRKEKSFLGYPSRWIVVDDILMDNTVGQCIALRLFLEKTKHLFNATPRLLFISNTYHIIRVLRTFGCNSPLMEPDFYLANVGLQKIIVEKLGQTALNYFLTMQDGVLKRSEIQSSGIDEHITGKLGWEHDLPGDMQAAVRYSRYQTPPSIAENISENVVTLQKAIVSHSLLWQFKLNLPYCCVAANIKCTNKGASPVMKQ